MHSRALIVAAVVTFAAACRLEHPPTPTAVSDSTSVARALSLSSVPRLNAGGAMTLRIDASRIGGTFASTFEREMAPAVNFARGRGAASQNVVVTVESLEIGEDSAVAIVNESTPSSSTRLRTLLIPRAEGGWRVVSQHVLTHTDIAP
jgi:hypothetical protein